jgi:hypothetical protein
MVERDGMGQRGKEYRVKKRNQRWYLCRGLVHLQMEESAATICSSLRHFVFGYSFQVLPNHTCGNTFIIPGQVEYGKWHPGWERILLTVFYSVLLDKTQREVDWPFTLSFGGLRLPVPKNWWRGKCFSQNSRGLNPLCVICLWQLVLHWMPSLVTEANRTAEIFLIEDYPSSHCFLSWIYFF